MKFKQLFQGDWFVVVDGVFEMRIMAKVDNGSAQYTAGVNEEGVMMYERNPESVNPDTEVVQISRIGILNKKEVSCELISQGIGSFCCR